MRPPQLGFTRRSLRLDLDHTNHIPLTSRPPSSLSLPLPCGRRSRRSGHLHQPQRGAVAPEGRSDGTVGGVPLDGGVLPRAEGGLEPFRRPRDFGGPRNDRGGAVLGAVRGRVSVQEGE